jgi:hypothetical protein
LIIKHAKDLDGNALFEQRFDRPAVYLDHWALRELSEKAAVGNRFTVALKKAGGTLLISYPNLVEFLSAEDPRHAKEAERFLGAALPNVFFADFNVVWRDEPPYPVTDHDLLKLVALKGISVDHIFEDLHAHRSELLPHVKTLKASIAGAVNGASEELRAQAKASAPSPLIPRVQLVMRELLRDSILDPGRRFSENDAMDLLHAGIPVSYCDYVLLDRAWVNRVERMRARIGKSGHDIRLPECFHKDGVEDFLGALEAKAVAGVKV